MDLGQGEVVVDVDSIDGPQIGDPVSVRQQGRLVDGHPILVAGAEDLNLQQQSIRQDLYGAFMEPTSEHQTRTCVVKFCSGMQWKHLEWLSPDKGEMLQLSLLRTPLLSNTAVPDDHLPAVVVKTRVEVEGQVTWCGHIHYDPEKQQRTPVRDKTGL